MEKKVAITGVGVLCPLGLTAKETAEAWRKNRKAELARTPGFAGTLLEHAKAAQLPAFEPAKRLGSKRMIKYMSHAALCGCVAAREACLQARIKERFSPERIGLFAGTGLAAAEIEEILPMIERSLDDKGNLSFAKLGKEGLPSTNPLLSFKILPNMPACLISIQENIKGHNMIQTPFEGNTAFALQEAYNCVRQGVVDCALAGASDHAAHPAIHVFLRQQKYLGENEFPASAGAYLVFEPKEKADRDGIACLAIIKNISIKKTNAKTNDPFSERMGRSFAAAPALLLAMNCLVPNIPKRMAGADQYEIQIEVEQC